MKKIYALKQSLLLSTSLLFFAHYIQAQNIFPSTGSAGIGTTTPNASSILDMVSTSKGMLIPRMTRVQRDAIAKPATALLIYQTNSAPGFYYYNGTAWTAVTPKTKGWSLTGNSGTIPGTNFIGTTDAQPLVLKVNNQKAGYLDYNNAKANTGLGYLTLNAITTGAANTAIGYNVLSSNTSGAGNTASGNNALAFNNSGSFNTVNGFDALGSNTAGGNNTANGSLTLTSNTTGSDNTASGNSALLSNTIGYSNVAMGSHALFNNTIASNNVAVGDSALYNQNGTYGGNTAVGSKALYSNSTGDGNTANGFQALYSNDEGLYNTASGSAALFHNTTGDFNTAFGLDALHDNLNGSGNTAIGYGALYSNNSGGNNTVIGSYTDVNSDGYFFSSAFGYEASITASNQVRIGDATTKSIGGYRAWTNISDGRVKKNIKENVPGLAFINLLKPITYNLDLDAADKIMQRPVIKDKNGKPIQPSAEQMNARNVQQRIVCTGFIAQDVEAIAKKIGYDFDGVDAAKNDKDLYGLRYSEFVVPLVKAVQELSKANDVKDSALAAQKKINQDLQNQINDLKAMITGKAISASTKNAAISIASLSQNIPNPFSTETTISYVLPQTYSSAYIIISDQNGRSLKQITLSVKGSGNVDLDASTLASGAYSYSLIVDGKLIDTKKMLLAK